MDEKGSWLPIEAAPKDGTPIWAVLKNKLERWSGVQIALKHPGIEEDGFDIGWAVTAPVGQGGIPDHWIAGWMPLPLPPQK